jgi:hypothetical protein
MAEASRLQRGGPTTCPVHAWGDWRVLTPQPPGSQPGALPLSYSHHEYLRPESNWRPPVCKTGARTNTSYAGKGCWPHPGSGPGIPTLIASRVSCAVSGSNRPRPVHKTGPTHQVSYGAKVALVQGFEPRSGG